MSSSAVTERPLQPREYALIPIVVALGMLLVYDVPFVGLPLAAFAIGRLVYSGSANLAYIAVAMAAIGSVWLGIARPVMVAPTMAALAWGAQAVTKRRMWQVFGVLTLIAMLTFVLSVSGAAALQGETLGDLVTAEIDLVMEQFDGVFDASTAEPALRTTYREVRDVVRTSLLQVWPGFNLLAMMLAAGLATVALGRMAVVHGHRVAGLKPLFALDVPIHIVWPLAAGLGLSAWVLYSDAFGTLLAAVAFNTLLVSTAVVSVQGIAVTDASMRRLRMGPLLRLLAYGLLFWTGALLPIAVAFGTGDLWIDFRKIRRGTTPTDTADGTPGEPPSGPSEDSSDGGVE